ARNWSITITHTSEGVRAGGGGGSSARAAAANASAKAAAAIRIAFLMRSPIRFAAGNVKRSGEGEPRSLRKAPPFAMIRIGSYGGRMPTYFTEQHEQFRKTVRDFAETDLAP